MTPPSVAIVRSWATQQHVRTLVLGDSHGDTGFVVSALAIAADQRCSGLVSVGDFGIWPGTPGRRFLDAVTAAAAEHGIPVVVVPGNHDDYDQIDHAPRADDGWIILSPWVLAAPRGHIWHVASRPWMGFGGAASIDGPGGAYPQVRGPALEGDSILQWDVSGQPRRIRLTEDVDFGGWWPRERITQDQVDVAVGRAETIARHRRFDVLVTHDVPAAFALTAWKDGLEWEPGERQRRYLQQVVNATQPILTVSGHWHRHAYFHDVPWHPRGKGRQVVLAADVSPEGYQWVIVDSNSNAPPITALLGRVDDDQYWAG